MHSSQMNAVNLGLRLDGKARLARGSERVHLLGGQPKQPRLLGMANQHAVLSRAREVEIERSEMAY